MRAALEELARTAPDELVGLATQDWGQRYGRPVRLGTNPTCPKTRIKDTGGDAHRLLEHLYRHRPELWTGPQIQALRQILVQNYQIDERGRIRWRTDDHGGLPPASARIVSP